MNRIGNVLYVFVVLAWILFFVGTLTASERFVVTSHSSGFMVTSRPAVPVASTLGIVNREAGHVSGAGGGQDAPTAVCITCYVQKGCPPCRRVEAWWNSMNSEQRRKLKFYIQFSDKLPPWLNSTPAFHWNGSESGKPYLIEGEWVSGDYLASRFAATGK